MLPMVSIRVILDNADNDRQHSIKSFSMIFTVVPFDQFVIS